MILLDLKMIMEEIKPYEGKKFSKNINENFIKFKRPIFGKDQSYKIGKVKIFFRSS